MPAKGSRAFTSLTPEDQQAIANGVSAPNAGSWKNQWNTNDIDNEFSMMGPSQQATLLQTMNWHRQRVNQEQQQYNNNQKSKAAADAAKAAGKNPAPNAAKAAADAAKAAEKKPAPNASGGQAAVPTVADRMSRMGMAVARGVAKGSIGMNQLGKYQVPGTSAPAATASPLVVQLGSSQQGQAQNAAPKPAPKPVPMPQGNLLGKLKGK